MTEANITVVADPAEARKRRKAIITSQRAETEGIVTNGVPSCNGETPTEEQIAPSDLPSEPIIGNADDVLPPPKKRKVDVASPPAASTGNNAAEPNDTAKTENLDTGNAAKKKAQIRYDPDVPMDKEQLAAWRREARRVRNRESAAASRQRIRSRITELEGEVEEWKTKYAQAIDRLKELEQLEATRTASAVAAAVAAGESAKSMETLNDTTTATI